MRTRITKDDILNFLRRRKPDYYESYNLTKLGLIGSFSRGEATPKSDIDLIVEFKPNTSDLNGRYEKLRRSVKRKFKRDVDICREKYIKPYYKKNILKDAIFI